MFMSSNVLADNYEKVKSKGLYLEQGVNYRTVTCFETCLGLNLRAGYNFSSKFGGGLSFKSYSPFSKNTEVYGIGCYGQYTPWRKGGFYVFCDLKFNWVYHREADSGLDFAWPYGPESLGRMNNVEIGFNPGIGYKIPGNGFGVRLRYLFIGYDNERDFFRDEYHCRKSICKDWIVDLGYNSMELSVYYEF